MDFSLTVLYKTIVLFILIIFGIVGYKTKVINKPTVDGLVKIVTNFVIPAQIIMSFQTEVTDSLVTGLLYAFVFSIISIVIAILLAKLIIRKKRNPNYKVDRISAIYSNCGFFGIPVIYGIFGSEGVIYLTAYIAVFNLLFWSHGKVLMIEFLDFVS